MADVNPYLNFSGNCAEAFNFYKSAFGGEFQTIMRFKDMKSDHPMPEAEGEKIMHVSLPIGKHTVLMGSDRPGSIGPVTNGDSFHISINAESEDEANKLFKSLSSGGQVIMPMEKSFWGAYFGMFSDKYGMNWMINYDYNQKQ